MRTRFYLATAVLMGATSGLFAQTTTPTTGGTGTGTGTGVGSTGPTGASSTPSTNANIQQMQDAPVISGLSQATVTSPTSNVFGGFYANPYFQGRTGSAVGSAPGGFGSPLYGTGTSAGARGATTGSAALRTGAGATGAGGAAGTAGLFGGGTGANTGRAATNALGGRTGVGATGAGGRGGLGTTGQSTSTIVALPRPITYTARLSMPNAPAMNPTAVQTEVQGLLGRSSLITNGGGIQVSVEGATVVLRGTVKDAEEAGTAEGVARLTPGVKVVKNELKY